MPRCDDYSFITLRLDRRNDTNDLAFCGALLREQNRPIYLGKQRVILADADVVAGMKHGPALTDDDVTCSHYFTAVTLDAEAFRFRVAAVT